MSAAEFEFNADFLGWFANQDPRFLDFMFRYYREMLELKQAKAYAKPPAEPTGKRIRIKFARTREELEAAAEQIVSEHNSVNSIPDRSKYLQMGPITADEILAFHQSLYKKA